uniref:uncharacterized protein LOC122597490 n=1 Tax=Erigeron canadensis TaxID=72917 RepID=UPI001CB8F626|nr:uncharacterized protein LOC122597490 [Erigeron canadensis]
MKFGYILSVDMRMSSSYICEDLIVDIFKRLPPKSLLRFRSVSKSLCSCIDSREFIRLHMLQSHPQKVVIIHTIVVHIAFKTVQNLGDDFYTLHSPEKLHLLSCPKCAAADGKWRACIMTFDFSTHGFGTIDLPNREKTRCRLMIIDGCLAVMSSDHNNTWIWVRRREHNNDIPCWSVHCKLEEYGSAEVYGNASHITTTGNFLVHFDFPYLWQVYNPETRKGSRLVDIPASSWKGMNPGTPIASSHIYDMEPYVESLELLDTGTTCDQRNQQQPSFVQGKKRSSRTTLRKLIDFFTPCSTPHAN